MRSILIWLTIVAAAFFIYTTAKADEINVFAAGTTNSQPSYGLGLEHDFSTWAYMGLSSSFTADYLSNSTTAAIGLKLFEAINLGVFSGYEVQNGGMVGEGGLEAGFTIPMNKDLYFEENNRLIRLGGDNNTELGFSVGIGLKL